MFRTSTRPAIRFVAPHAAGRQEAASQEHEPAMQARPALAPSSRRLQLVGALISGIISLTLLHSIASSFVPLACHGSLTAGAAEGVRRG